MKQLNRWKPPPDKKNSPPDVRSIGGGLKRQFTKPVDCQNLEESIPSIDSICQNEHPFLPHYGKNRTHSDTPSIPHYTTQFQQNQRTTAALDLLRQADLRLANLQ